MMTVSDLWMGRLKVALSLLAIMLIAAGGAWLAVWLTPKPVPEDVAAAPMVRQADQSVIAERAFTPKPAPPRHAIPKGYVEERRESVHIALDVPKKDVEVDLSLVRNGNEVRAVVSSPDGAVTYAQDSVIVPTMTPAPILKSAIGLSYGSDRAVGVWAEHDIGRLRLGVEVSKGQGKPRAEIRVGVAF